MLMIESRIEEFLALVDSPLVWTKSAVRIHGFLPLFLDWTTVFGIRPDLSVVRWDHDDDPDVVKPLEEGFLHRLVLCQGTKRYPELNVLIPEPPSNAQKCGVCEDGVLVGAEHFICECGGLGWTIPGEHEP